MVFAVNDSFFFFFFFFFLLLDFAHLFLLIIVTCRFDFNIFSLGDFKRPKCLVGWVFLALLSFL